MRALNLQGNPPTATVPAAFSKRRRQDTQVLHPELARQLQTWLATKPKLGPEDLLFPVSARAGGIERKTHKMMQHDLESARKVWLKEAESPQDQEAREKSDFLAYANHAGHYADFHLVSASVHHQPRARRHPPQGGPDPGPAQRYSADAQRPHACWPGRPGRRDRGVAGTTGRETLLTRPSFDSAVFRAVYVRCWPFRQSVAGASGI